MSRESPARVVFAWLGRMTNPQVSRADVLEVVKSAANALRAARAKPDDPKVVPLALAAACVERGVSPQAFDDAITADPELERLKGEALREAVLGATDPGPYAEVSRESSSGLPGDTTKSRTKPEP